MSTVPLLTRPLLAFFLKVFPLFSSPLRSLATSLSSKEMLTTATWQKRSSSHLTSLPFSPLSILASPLLTSSLATLGQNHWQCRNPQQRYYLFKIFISKQGRLGAWVRLNSALQWLGPHIVWPTLVLGWLHWSHIGLVIVLQSVR